MGELITMCSSPALIGLGIVPAPGKEEPEVDLHLARHFIDLLTLLDEKTAGQLDEAETKGIQQALHELRMGFVQIQQASQQQADAPTDPSQHKPPEDEAEDEAGGEAGGETEAEAADTPEPQTPDDQEPDAETPGDSETAEAPAGDG